MEPEVRKLFEETEFTGVPKYVWSWLYKLSKLYPDRLCFPFECREKSHMAYFNMEAKEKGVSIKARVREAIIGNCPTYPFTGFVIVFKSSPKELHANALLLDKERKVLVRFEPRGSRMSYDWRALDSALHDLAASFAKEMDMPGLRYVSPNDYEDYAGPQTREMLDVGGKREALPKAGPCVLWSLLFCHMAVAFPDKDYKDIARALNNPLVESSLLAQAYSNIMMRDIEVLPEC